MKRCFIHSYSLFALFGFLISPIASNAQSADLKVVDWQPISQLVVEKTNILKPKYPVIDVHDYLGKLENTAKYLEEMDKAGVWKVVSLDGRSANDFYKEHLKASAG